jgi:ATP-dependent protease HslVU (ClpYQ) ATPase subunit
VLELPQRLRLDLADALAGHRELLADFFQSVVGVHADSEAIVYIDEIDKISRKSDNPSIT